MDANGVRCLVDLLTLAHLHTSRATVPMQVSTFTSMSRFVDCSKLINQLPIRNHYTPSFTLMEFPG